MDMPTRDHTVPEDRREACQLAHDILRTYREVLYHQGARRELQDQAEMFTRLTPYPAAQPRRFDVQVAGLVAMLRTARKGLAGSGQMDRRNQLDAAWRAVRYWHGGASAVAAGADVLPRARAAREQLLAELDRLVPGLGEPWREADTGRLTDQAGYRDSFRRLT